MQSDAAVTRSEANAADAAATSLSTSMNRKERLTAIEDEITQLKGQADSQAASAQQAAEDAASKQSELEALRKKSDEERAQLEAQKKSLSTKEAQEAAELVSMKAEIDSWSVQNNTGSGECRHPRTAADQARRRQRVGQRLRFRCRLQQARFRFRQARFRFRQWFRFGGPSPADRTGHGMNYHGARQLL